MKQHHRLFNHTVSLFLCYKHSNHRSTGIKVYSSDINSDVYGSDRVNHIFESRLIWHFKWRCIYYIVTPVGGEKGLLKCICLWIIQEIHSRTLIHPVMKQVHLEWVIESFIHKLHVILFTCLMFFFSSESWENHNFHWEKKRKQFILLNLSRIMQFYFAHKQLLKSPVYMKSVDFCSWYSVATKWFAKMRQDKCLISLFNHIGIKTGNR